MSFIPKEIYTTILEYMPIPTVDILFLKSNWDILLAKRNNEPLKWVYYIPWGRVEKWEKSLDAAKRKAKEELGIDIDILKLIFLGIYDDIFDNSAFPGISTHCIPVTYSYQLSDEELREIHIGDAQHSDYRFFPQWSDELHPMVKLRIDNIKK
jgi:ADP-ribose pyrophosphatase YjhB (NUDIX family)